jgi:hypothetical protein
MMGVYANQAAVTWPFNGHPTLATGIEVYYKSDTNGSFPDATWNSDGTINWATFTASWQINWAYDYDWVNDYVDTNYRTTLSDYSYSIWIETPASAPWAFVYPLSVRDSSWGNDEFVLVRIDTSWILHTLDTRSAAWFQDVQSNSSITDWGWHHIVATSQKNGSLLLYIDWVLQTDTWTVDNDDLNTPGQDWHIWTFNDDGSLKNYYDWKIDEIWIWNKELTSSEVTSLYNSGSWLQY